MKKYRKAMFLFLFTFILSLLLTSCGGDGRQDGNGAQKGKEGAEKTEEADGNLSSEETIHFTNYIFQDSLPLDVKPTTDSGYNGVQLTENGIYAGYCSFDPESRILTQTIQFLPIVQFPPLDPSSGEGGSSSTAQDSENADSGIPSETVLSMDLSGLTDSFGYAAAKWRVDESGNIFAAVSISQGMQTKLCGIFKFSPDGTLLAESADNALLENYSFTGSLAVDREGTLFLLASVGEYENKQTNLLLFPGDGSIIRASGLEEADPYGLIPYGLFCGRDGYVYAAVTDAQGKRSLNRLDDRGNVVETRADFPAEENSRITAETPLTLLYTDADGVCRYDLQTGETDKLFSWLDYNILPSEVTGLFSDGTEELYAVRLLFDTASMTLCRFLPGEEESSADSSSSQEDPTKKEPERIVLAALWEDTSLQNLVYEFNKSQSDYHAVIQSYLSPNADYDEITAQADHMGMDLATGNNDYDLISLSNLDRNTLNNSGLLEDLYPYLDKSGALDRENLFEAVLSANTINGKLVTIPHVFHIYCLAGKKSLLGNRTGWTLRELLDFAKEHSDARLFSSSLSSSAITYTLFYGTDSFITMEGDNPVFDTALCGDLLEMVKNTPDLPSERPKSAPEMLQDEEALLVSAYIQDFSEVQLYKAFFADEPIVFTGFPTPDGRNGNLIETSSLNDLFSILTTSSHKEGAWALLEFFIINGSNKGGIKYGNGQGFPVIKSDFEEEAVKAVKEQYILDEKGNFVRDKDGKPKLKSQQTYETNGWEYIYDPVTQDDIEIVKELLSRGAHPILGRSDTFNQIFDEESAAYLNGQKSLEETVDIMKSRMMLYYSENY